MNWTFKRFALFDPKIPPFFLRKRGREEPQPQEETLNPSSSKRNKPETSGWFTSSVGRHSPGAFRLGLARSNRGRIGVRRGWKVRLEDALRGRYGYQDSRSIGGQTNRFGTGFFSWWNAEQPEESGDADEMDTEADESGEIDEMDTEAVESGENAEMDTEAVEPAEDGKKDTNTLVKDEEGDKEEEEAHPNDEGVLIAEPEETAEAEEGPQMQPPAERLVRDEFEQLGGLIGQDPELGSLEEQRPAMPHLRHFSARTRSQANIRRIIQEACASIMSQPAVRKAVDEAARAETDSLQRYQSSQWRKRPQPGPEKEKYRPGRKNKEAKTTHFSLPQPTAPAADVSRSYHKRMLMKRMDKSYYWSGKFSCPTLRALHEERYKSENPYIPSSFASGEPKEPVHPQLTNRGRNMWTWKPEDRVANVSSSYIDLRSRFEESMRVAREKYEESAKRREQVEKDLLEKTYPSLEELKSIHDARSISSRCAKFQTARVLRSPVLERKLFPAVHAVPTSPESSHNESEQSSWSSDASNGSPDSCLPVRNGQGIPYEFGVKLTDKDRKKFDAVTKKRDKRVVTEVDKVLFTRKMLSCLGHGEWLNDEIMNGYLKLLQERDTRFRAVNEDAPKCHFHTTYFMNRLYMDDMRYCYKNVQRWTMPQKLKNWGQQSDSIIDCDIIFFPVHLDMHWVLFAAFMKEKKIKYFDSLQGKGYGLFDPILKYIRDETMDKKGIRSTVNLWQVVNVRDVPRQNNSCDCGVYALQFAKSRSELNDWENDWGFDESYIPDLRVGMLKEFLAKSIL